MANIPDDQIIEDIRRWHAMHRDTADQTWRWIDALLAHMDREDRECCEAHDEEISSLSGQIEDLEHQLNDGMIEASMELLRKENAELKAKISNLTADIEYFRASTVAA